MREFGLLRFGEAADLLANEFLSLHQNNVSVSFGACLEQKLLSMGQVISSLQSMGPASFLFFSLGEVLLGVPGERENGSSQHVNASEDGQGKERK